MAIINGNSSNDHVLVSCGHCKGTGTCKRSQSGNCSCDSCVSKAGLSNTWNGKIVKCGICNGTGQALIKAT